jgi:glycine/D-amino acid oxidase-like deaminating enzyme
MFEPLRDPEVFSQVGVDEFGAVFWPNGADLAPDALYQHLLEKPQQATRMN